MNNYEKLHYVLIFFFSGIIEDKYNKDQRYLLSYEKTCSLEAKLATSVLCKLFATSNMKRIY